MTTTAPADPWAVAAQAFTSAQALDRIAPPPWRETARPEQLPPDDWTRVWYLRGGRDSGKTWAGSRNLADLIHAYPGEDWAVLAPTFGDARDVCVEGRKSGLLRALGPLVVNWNRSMGEIQLTTGGKVFVDGADDGAYRVQGKRLAGAWCDEIGLWKRWQDAWDESLFYAVTEAPGLILATGTPKANQPARKLVQRLLDDDAVPVSQLTTESNRDHIDPTVYAEMMTRIGSRLGQQELLGELLDAEGVIWRAEWISRNAVLIGDVPHLARVLVLVDPSGSDTGAETGIVVLGQGADGDVYVLDDRSLRADPTARYRAICEAAVDYGAVEIVAEEDFGADNIPYLIAQAWSVFARSDLRVRRLARVPQVRSVKARNHGNKRERATAAADWYEMGRVHHVRHTHDDDRLDLLEGQMTEWAGDGPSPDRLDALAHGVREILGVARTASVDLLSRGQRLVGRR